MAKATDSRVRRPKPRLPPGWTLSRSLGYQRSLMAPPRPTLPALLLGAALLAPAPALAATGASGPDMQPILLALMLMILGARLGGSAAERFGQPAVLGELAAGIAIGNLGLLGYHGLDGLRDLAAIQVFAQIGAADRGQAFHFGSVVWILAKSLLFLAGALLVGRWLSARIFALATRLRGEGLLLPFGLAFCFGLAFLAALAGLAPIVGAFAAGLILDERHYRELMSRDREGRDIQELVGPIESFLVPVFFVLMGMHVDLRVFGSPGALGFAALLTVAAVLGKQACAIGVLELDADRLAVGLGMIPRGEVGLIFASIGATLMIGGERVVDDTVYSAVVAMVAATTLLTPPLLVWRLKGSGRSRRVRARVESAAGAADRERSPRSAGQP